MKKCTLLFFFTFLVAHAQYKITHYTTANGLPHDLCYGIIQDHKGYIWIGTDDGLVKYNGKDFKIFQIKDGLFSNYVIDVCELNDSTLAIATWGGGMQLLQKNTVLPYTGHKKDKINKIANLPRFLFAKGTGHLYHFYSKKNNTYSETIVSYYFDNTLIPAKNAMLNNTVKPQFEVINNEVYLFNDVLFSNETLKGVYKIKDETHVKRVFPFLKDRFVNDIKKVTDSTFLAVTNNEILFFSDHAILKRKMLPFKNSTIRKATVKGNRIVLVVQDNQDKSEQIAIWNKKSNSFFYMDKNELGGKQISDILIDKDDNIWISVYGSGVFKLTNDKQFQISNDLQNNNIYDVAKYKSKVYFLTSSKIIGIEPNRKLKDSLLYKESLWKFDYLIKDTILLHTKEKTLDKETRKIFNVNVKTSNLEYFVYEDSLLSIKYGDNNIRIRKNNKIFKFLFNGVIKKVIKKKDKLYSCTNKGLFIYDLNTLQLETKYTTDEGIVNNDIRDVVITNDSTIYIATINGLSVVKHQKIENYNDDIGLLSLNINCLYLDSHDVVWLGTQKGFSIFKDQTFYSFYKNATDNSSFIQKIVEDDNQRIWLVGNNGSMMIDNKVAFEPVLSPILDIEKQKERLFVNIISFDDFEAITEYKINTNNWETLKTDMLDFTKFQYGAYEVLFRTRSTNSNWNYSKKYTIIHKAPWYKQWWSYCLITLLISSLIIAFLYFRFKRVKQRNELLRQTIYNNDNLQRELNEVRENVAQDFHDELGNKLAGITVLSGMMIENEEIKSSKWFAELTRINKDAQELYFGIKDFIWSIDSKNDDLQELIFYLKDFGAELFSSTSTQFNSLVDLGEIQVKLPYYWSRQLLLLFKEAMTNTFKYAQASNCILEVKLEKDYLQISFSDNGKGFNENELKRKNGILNMRKRASKIEGELEFFFNHGTTVKFTSKRIV